MYTFLFDYCVRVGRVRISRMRLRLGFVSYPLSSAKSTPPVRTAVFGKSGHGLTWRLLKLRLSSDHAEFPEGLSQAGGGRALRWRQSRRTSRACDPLRLDSIRCKGRAGGWRRCYGPLLADLAAVADRERTALYKWVARSAVLEHDEVDADSIYGQARIGASVQGQALYLLWAG